MAGREESLQRVGGYVSGNIAVSIIAGLGAFAFLRIFGIPFAAALAMWVAIADLIPTVGATLGALRLRGSPAAALRRQGRTPSGSRTSRPAWCT